MSLLVLMLVFGSVPIGGLLYIRWRFQPKRMRENAERLLRDAEARMEAMSDDELVCFFREHPYLNGAIAASKPARRVRELVDGRAFARLATEWAALWPELLDAEVASDPKKKPQILDYTLELNAAAAVLQRRHPT